MSANESQPLSTAPPCLPQSAYPENAEYSVESATIPSYPQYTSEKKYRPEQQLLVTGYYYNASPNPDFKVGPNYTAYSESDHDKYCMQIILSHSRLLWKEH
jgi:hypothetical protein